MFHLTLQSHKPILTQQDLNIALLEYDPEQIKRRKEYQERIKTLAQNVLGETQPKN